MNHVIDTDDLLQEVSPETPCGGVLEYDPDFVAMEQASRGKAEQQIGDSVVPAEAADWPTVKSKALDLFTRTKDLRAGVLLTQALVSVDGLVGLHDGLALVAGLIERYWDDVHPNLDPDDGDDPMMRVNTLLNLCDPDMMLRTVRDAELAGAKGLGRYSFRDYLVAEGKLAPPSDPETSPATMPGIVAAFTGCDLEALQERAEAVNQAVDLVALIESGLMMKVGAKHAVGFDPLADLLKGMNELLSEQVARRTGSSSEGAAGGNAGKSATGEINTREDVIRVLDRACDYFHRNEPSSPVPLLLKRAKGLVSKEFLDIIRDLAPGSVPEVEKIRGPESGTGAPPRPPASE